MCSVSPLGDENLSQEDCFHSNLSVHLPSKTTFLIVSEYVIRIDCVAFAAFIEGNKKKSEINRMEFFILNEYFMSRRIVFKILMTF